MVLGEPCEKVIQLQRGRGPQVEKLCSKRMRTGDEENTELFQQNSLNDSMKLFCLWYCVSRVVSHFLCLP